MRQAFRKVLIFKPVTSRPANSERYIVCYSLKSDDIVSIICQYMRSINEELDRLEKVNQTVLEVVPFEIMKQDEKFFEYIKKSNDELVPLKILSQNRLCINFTSDWALNKLVHLKRLRFLPRMSKLK